LLLLGDAAHPMAPVRAQGINLALRDAIVAANHLVPALATRDGDAIAAAAARVQQEREPEVVVIQRLQQAAMQLPLPLRSTLLRGTVAPILRRTGAMKRMILKSEIPFRHGVTDVRLAV
jgi:2-polyprenyl-6-methoxyphenol hydroxylase-like FAD-dependent oxidoreductase